MCMMVVLSEVKESMGKKKRGEDGHSWFAYVCLSRHLAIPIPSMYGIFTYMDG